jgi:hypothetical protein
MPLIRSLISQLCNIKLQYLILLSTYSSMKETEMTDHFSDESNYDDDESVKYSKL